MCGSGQSGCSSGEGRSFLGFPQEHGPRSRSDPLLGLLAAGAISLLVTKEQIEESMGGGMWAYVAAVVAGLHFGKSKREVEETFTEEVNKRIDSLHRPLGWRPPAFAAPLAGQYCLRCRCKMWLSQTGVARGILNAFENASRYITVRCSQ